MSKTKQLAGRGLFCAFATCAAVSIPDLIAQESLLQKELNRRINNTKTAQNLIISGDKAYNEQDYETAVKNYSEAFQLLPNGTLNAELRIAAADRYATAATERSRRIMKFGHYDEARDLLDGVLKPDISPGHLGATRLRQQLDDPIRYNPALSPEHVTDVVKVGRLLREGEGFHSLGLYNQASESYNDVLRLDPYNKAARRGLEKINSSQSDYYRAARDQTRAEMLNDVNQAWELPVLPDDIALPTEYSLDSSNVASSLKNKIDNITLDSVMLDNVDIEEALDYVRIQSRLADVPNAGGEQDGINIVLNLGNKNSEAASAVKNSRVNIQVTNLPLSVLLDIIAEQTGTKWRNNGVAIIFTALDSDDDEMMTKTFIVPPTFLSGSATSDGDSAEDIFGDNNNDGLEGKLAKRISAKDYLMKNGVTFPDGASASYIASSNSLIVKNTQQNMEIVDQIASNAAAAEPIQILTEVTIIRVSETELKELGFDWLLSPIDIGSALLGGGSVGSGFLGDVGASITNAAPVTAGLRSGTATQSNNALDTFLNSTNSGFGVTQQSAPAILSLTRSIGPAQVQLVMRGLDQSESADIMLQPSVVSKNGERATIESIRELIYPTEYEPPELPQSFTSTNSTIFLANGTVIGGNSPINSVVSPSHPTAFEMRKTGVTLEVEATADDNNNFINLSLNPQVVEFEGFVNYGSPINGTSGGGLNFNALGGVFNNTGVVGEITQNDILMPIFKTITTGNITTTVQDGQTVVLAGLVTSKKSKTEDKVPLLGDIPIAGRLFKTIASSTYDEAVIIMVNSKIIDPGGRSVRGR